MKYARGKRRKLFHNNFNRRVMPQNKIMTTIVPVNQNEVFNQYVECDNVRSAWLAVAVKWMEQTEMSPYGDLWQMFEGAYRLCIKGQLQPVRSYTDCAFATTWKCHLLDKVQERAMDEFRHRANIHNLGDLNCWNLSIISSNTPFIESLNDRITSDVDNNKYKSEYVNLHKVNAVEISLDDEARMLRDDNFRMWIG